MSEQTLRRLGLVAVVLLVLWGASSVMGRGAGGGGAGDVPEEVAGFFHDLDRASVDSVRLVSAGGARTLARTPDGWRVNGFRPDSGTVARFWTAVEEAEIGGLVARNPDNHERMGLTEDQATRVVFHVDGAERTLLVGNAGGSWGTAYVRLPGADEAWLLDADLRSHATRSLSDWRDKRVAAVDSAVVTRLEIEVDGGTLELARADSLWRIEGEGGEADAGSVRDLLGELVSLRATGFLAAGDSLADRAAAGHLLALDAAGDTLVYLTVGAGDGDRWVRARGDSTTYRVTGWRADRLLPSADDLRGS